MMFIVRSRVILDARSCASSADVTALRVIALPSVRLKALCCCVPLPASPFTTCFGRASICGYRPQTWWRRQTPALTVIRTGVLSPGRTGRTGLACQAAIRRTMFARPAAWPSGCASCHGAEHWVQRRSDLGVACGEASSNVGRDNRLAAVALAAAAEAVDADGVAASCGLRLACSALMDVASTHATGPGWPARGTPRGRWRVETGAAVIDVAFFETVATGHSKNHAVTAPTFQQVTSTPGRRTPTPWTQLQLARPGSS